MKEENPIAHKIGDFVTRSLEDDKLSFERFFNKQTDTIRIDADVMKSIDPKLVNLSYYLAWSRKYPHLPHKILIDQLELDEWTTNLRKDLEIFKRDIS